MHQFGEKVFVPAPPTPPPARQIHEGVGCTSHGTEHFHKAPDGTLVRCYHECKSTIKSAGFWLGVTISFPLEHFLWEHIWPLSILTKFLGL